MAASLVKLSTKPRTERCFECHSWIRAEYVVPFAGMCGTGTFRTAYCAACSPTPQTVPTIQRVYRDQTVNDAIQSAVDEKFDPDPFRF